jgi:hypothetical protein
MIEAVSGSKGAIGEVPGGVDLVAGLNETICPTIAGMIRVGMAQCAMTIQNEGVWKKPHCGEGIEDMPPFGVKGSWEKL